MVSTEGEPRGGPRDLPGRQGSGSGWGLRWERSGWALRHGQESCLGRGFPGRLQAPGAPSPLMGCGWGGTETVAPEGSLCPVCASVDSLLLETLAVAPPPGQPRLFLSCPGGAVSASSWPSPPDLPSFPRQRNDSFWEQVPPHRTPEEPGIGGSCPPRASAFSPQGSLLTPSLPAQSPPTLPPAEGHPLPPLWMH